jgi:hypothetical protein
MHRSVNRRLGSELSSSLTTTIATFKSKIDKWAEMECARADALVQTHQKKLQHEQKAIDYHVADLLAVQLELGFKVDKEDDENVHSNATSESIVQRKQALEDSYLVMKAEIAHLEIDFNRRNILVNGKLLEAVHSATSNGCLNQYPLTTPFFYMTEIQLEQSKHEARSKEARELKERVKESKQTTVDDLTRGIVNYKYLGLDFEKADGENELRSVLSIERCDAINLSHALSLT